MEITGRSFFGLGRGLWSRTPARAVSDTTVNLQRREGDKDPPMFLRAIVHLPTPPGPKFPVSLSLGSVSLRFGLTSVRCGPSIGPGRARDYPWFTAGVDKGPCSEGCVVCMWLGLQPGLEVSFKFQPKHRSYSGSVSLRFGLGPVMAQAEPGTTAGQPPN